MNRSILLILLSFFACKTDSTEDTAELQATLQAENEQEQALLDSVRTATITSYLDSLAAAMPEQPVPLADLYERASEGVYLIIAVDHIGNVSQGTGFLINASGLLVTNYHVIKDMMEGAIVYDQEKYVLIDRVIRQDTLNDWAVIRVMPGLPPGVVLPIAREMPRIGEECFAIGNPCGLTQTLSTGVVSGYRGPERLIQTTTEITHGSSGGPLFNRRGEVIGITTKGIGEANLNFAVNIGQLKIDDLFDFPVPHLNVYADLPFAGKVRTCLDKYYRARISGETDQLINCYAPMVNQHFHEYALSPVEAAASDTEERWSGRDIPVAYEPQWDQIIIDALEDGIAIRLPVVYSAIDRTGEGSRQEDRLYQFELDSLYRIRRVEMLE